MQRPVVVSELSDTLLTRNGSSATLVVRYFEALDHAMRDPLYLVGKPAQREFGDIICTLSERRHP